MILVFPEPFLELHIEHDCPPVGNQFAGVAEALFGELARAEIDADAAAPQYEGLEMGRIGLTTGLVVGNEQPLVVLAEAGVNGLFGGPVGLFGAGLLLGVKLEAGVADDAAPADQVAGGGEHRLHAGGVGGEEDEHVLVGAGRRAFGLEQLERCFGWRLLDGDWERLAVAAAISGIAQG